jgi:hypothetical protein
VAVRSERLTPAMLGCSEDTIPYLKLYKDKMCMWGAYVLAQASAISMSFTCPFGPMPRGWDLRSLLC